MEKERDFAAGLLLSLCAIKFHLFCLLPATLWILGRRRVLAGGAAGAVALAVVSFMAEGPDWPLRYLALLRNPVIHPMVEGMPNLHGLMRSFGSGAETLATVAASVVLAALVLRLAWRERSHWQAGFAYALLGGLLVSWHSYMHDAVLLLPVLAILQKGSVPAAVRVPLAITFLPLTFLMLLAASPWSGVPPLLVCAILAGAFWRSDPPKNPQSAELPMATMQTGEI
jgi:hypothetical protein